MILVNGEMSAKIRVYQLNDKDEIINAFASLGDVAKKTGYCKTSIADVCRGIYKKAYGYKWAYIEQKGGKEKTFNTGKIPNSMK